MNHSGTTAIVTLMTDSERRWATEALDSVLNQTMLPESVLVLVETNNDWISVELDRLVNQKLRHKLIEVHRIPIARLGAVRNLGTQKATTPWVAFLDGDDVWKPKRLERQLQAASHHENVSFVAADFEFVDIESRPFAYSNGSYPTPSAWLVRGDVLLAAPFHPTAVEGEDYDWLRKTKNTVNRLRVPEVLVSYRIRPSSLSSVHKMSRQRKLRERAANAARIGLIRYTLLSLTYLRYRMNLVEAYDI